MKNTDLIDSDVFLEAISLPEKIPYFKRKVVFIICPDPYESKTPYDTLRYGFRAAADSGRKNESPELCYSFKLGLYGFNQWTLRTTPFSQQQLFDMQVSQMLRSNFIAVYSNDSVYTESMEKLLNIAKVNIARIDFRSI